MDLQSSDAFLRMKKLQRIMFLKGSTHKVSKNNTTSQAGWKEMQNYRNHGSFGDLDLWKSYCWASHWSRAFNYVTPGPVKPSLECFQQGRFHHFSGLLIPVFNCSHMRFFNLFFFSSRWIFPSNTLGLLPLVLSLYMLVKRVPPCSL